MRRVCSLDVEVCGDQEHWGFQRERLDWCCGVRPCRAQELDLPGGGLADLVGVELFHDGAVSLIEKSRQGHGEVSPLKLPRRISGTQKRCCQFLGRFSSQWTKRQNGNKLTVVTAQGRHRDQVCEVRAAASHERIDCIEFIRYRIFGYFE